jgi:hypothetical protein
MVDAEDGGELFDGEEHRLLVCHAASPCRPATMRARCSGKGIRPTYACDRESTRVVKAPAGRLARCRRGESTARSRPLTSFRRRFARVSAHSGSIRTHALTPRARDRGLLACEGVLCSSRWVGGLPSGRSRGPAATSVTQHDDAAGHEICRALARAVEAVRSDGRSAGRVLGTGVVEVERSVLAECGRLFGDRVADIIEELDGVVLQLAVRIAGS